MRLRLLCLFIVTVLALSVSGCDGLYQDQNPGETELTNGMDLVGEWIYILRRETITNSAIIEATLEIQSESCYRNQIQCELIGYIEMPVFRAESKHLVLSGHSFPDLQLVRIEYDDKTPWNEDLHVIAELDLHPTGNAPYRSMVGYWVAFNKQASSPVNDFAPDLPLLKISGRGKLTDGGRISMWPRD
ncbi:MAG: hypothetical protein A2Z21_01200 [Candidatus Fraserbacteria bacterium RBG_16_55_9]|uniref:Lipocalin-like domain-containing protein n=1 Tax=Fraserbacteria sp. (strain RBG_16_55_9) TaxID=1817864 RepID=A0A1F5UQ97_FRAXR|nr:MAG: hypothetical protein A2Z21_01200 [Candidatus Fraserbacteria bacterium RBG_16_55_9]